MSTWPTPAVTQTLADAPPPAIRPFGCPPHELATGLRRAATVLESVVPQANTLSLARIVTTIVLSEIGRWAPDVSIATVVAALDGVGAEAPRS